MTTERQSLHLRLPEDLHKLLSDEAQRLGISLNSLTITALRYWEAHSPDSPKKGKR